MSTDCGAAGEAAQNSPAKKRVKISEAKAPKASQRASKKRDVSSSD